MRSAPPIIPAGHILLITNKLLVSWLKTLSRILPVKDSKHRWRGTELEIINPPFLLVHSSDLFNYVRILSPGTQKNKRFEFRKCKRNVG